VRSGFSVLVAAILIVACAPRAATTAERGIPAPQVVSVAEDEVTVNVLELICQTCAEQIIAGCRSIRGVTAVDVSRKDRHIALRFDPSITSRYAVLSAVDAVVASVL
jgi:copper chaperone CopZ